MGNLFTEEVGKVLTEALGNLFTEEVGKVLTEALGKLLDIYSFLYVKGLSLSTGVRLSVRARLAQERNLRFYYRAKREKANKNEQTYSSY